MHPPGSSEQADRRWFDALAGRPAPPRRRPGPARHRRVRGWTAARADRVGAALDKAEALLNEAQTLFEQAGETLSCAFTDVAYQRTVLACARDDWDATLRMARRERELIQRIDGPDAATQLDALATLAAITSALRGYDETMKIVTEGRRLARLAPRASLHAYLGILNTESVVLLDLGRPTHALAVAEEALTLAILG